MIELLFSDSTAGALALAKRDGGGSSVVNGVIITRDDKGNTTSEPYQPEPYSGPTIEGSPSDIAAIWLLADMGDISDLPYSHIELWQKINDNYADEDAWDAEDGWSEHEAERAKLLVARLRETAQTKEPVRIWWSDEPEEVCGFYWAMDILKDSDGPVTCIKIPPFYQAETGFVKFRGSFDVKPEIFSQLLHLERSVEIPERRAIASEWQGLVAENAPLRAEVNGHLCSVPENFYDYVLRRVIPDSECEVITIIGRALFNSPMGPRDWWYAWRLKEMIAGGELRLIKENKTFYASIVKS